MGLFNKLRKDLKAFFGKPFSGEPPSSRIDGPLAPDNGFDLYAAYPPRAPIIGYSGSQEWFNPLSSQDMRHALFQTEPPAGILPYEYEPNPLTGPTSYGGSSNSRLDGPFVPDNGFDPNIVYRPRAHPAPAQYRQNSTIEPWRPTQVDARLHWPKVPVSGYSSQPPSDPFSFQNMRHALPQTGTPAGIPPYGHKPNLVDGSASYGGSSHSPLAPQCMPGTYGDRNREQRRLGIRAYSEFECEHVLGYSTVNPEVPRKTAQGQRLEGGMPAYYETIHLHQEHPGSNYNSRPLDPDIHGGWKFVGDFRRDQRQTLVDAVAAGENTAVSNAYQLTELGYAHILRAEQAGRSRPQKYPDYIRFPPPLPPSYYVDRQQEIATNSYNNMVRHDPPIVHRLNGTERTVRLGPQGQAEALLAREVAMNGRWPANQTIERVGAEVLPPPIYEEKQKIWQTLDARAPAPAPPYDVRDRRSNIGR